MSGSVIDEQKVYRRILRREQHRSRSTAVVVVLALAVIAVAYVGTESVLAALGYAPLLVTPDAALAAVNSPSTAVIAGAVAAVVVGLVVLIVALVPGRRPRHSLPNERLAVVVDDAVLAGALGRAGRTAASVAADRVRTTVSARRARVSVVPTSGIPIDAASVESATRTLAEQLSPRPRLRVDVAISPSGAVGS